jgi:N-acetylmuramoyl-L-alanine amidase
LKVKIFLIATLFVFSTYSVTHASVLTHSVENGKGFAYLQYLSDEVEILLGAPEESDIPFQKFLEKDLLVDYPSLELTPEPEQEMYTVIEGDNLYRIALNHNISLDTLTSLNDLTGDLIHPGDVLIISGDEEDIETVEIESDTITAVFSPSPTPSPPSVSDGREMLVTATAYTAYCTGCSGTTAYGIDLRSNPHLKVIAVDPKIIPLGTRVWVEGYGEAIAGDTGGAIKGNKIDVFIPSYDNAMAWGVKKVKLKVFN